MPLNDYQKNWLIQQSGYDPKDYDFDEGTKSIVSKVPQQPASSPTVYQPKLDPGYRPVGQPQTTATGAFARSAVEAAPSSIAGGAGAGLGALALGAAGLDMTGIGALAGIPLMALAAYGAAKGTKAIQKQVEPEQFQQEVAQGQQEHPYASLAGGLATIPLGGFGPNSLKNIGSAAGAIPKLIARQSLTPAESANLMNVGIGTALPPIQNIVESEAEGKGMPSATSLLGNAALGAYLSRPNTIGNMFGFHDVEAPGEPYTDKLLKRANVSKVENAEPALTSGLENLPTRYTKPESELSKEEQTRLSLEGGHNISGSIEGAPYRGKAMAKYKANPEDMSSDEARAAAEGMGEISRYRKLENDAKENLKSTGVDLPKDLFPENEFSKAISDVEQGTPAGKAALRKKGQEESLSPDIQEAINQGDVKLQESSAITTEGENKTKALLAEKGYAGNLTPEWFAVSRALGKKRGVDLKTNENLETPGRSFPSDRQAVESALAEISPSQAGADTPTHEIGHIFINDLRNSNRAQDINFVKRYDSHVEQLPDYQRWAKERAAANKNSSVEEYQMTNQGVETVNRALSTEKQFQRWKNDFYSYLKTRWSKHATQEDFQRIMNYKLLNDPAYYKILGIKPPSYMGSGITVKNQEESNLPLNRLPKEEPPIKDETGKINELYKKGEIDLDTAGKLLLGNPKNQEESNLVNPQHDSIKKAINEGVTDENLTPERADILENALKTQVKWPTESAIPSILNGKQDLHNTYGDIGKFDNLDQDHWKQLRQIYNNEYDTYSEKAQSKQLASKVEQSKVEVPRTIPEVATEAAKTSAERAQKTTRLKPTTEIKDLTQIPGKVVGEKPKLDESKLTTEHKVTPEERAQDLKASKMSWDEIDNTTNPQATMDKLKSQYDEFTNRQHEAFGQGDRDTANKLADLRTATLMRMHYLGEKKGVEVPATEKYQDISNLKEPNLHNRVSEFGKKEYNEPLDYITPKGFTTQLDKIRKTKGVEGKAFANEFEKYAPLKDELYGKYWAPVQKGLKGLSKEDKTRVLNTLLMERRDQQDYRGNLSDKQQKAYDAIRGALRQKQEDQIAAGQMVTDYKPDGTKFQRPAQIDPFYFPHKISSKVAEQLAENTPAAQTLKEDFLAYQKQHGVSQKIAEQKLQAIEDAYDAAKPNLTRFGAVREAEGIGLPDSWMKNDLAGNLSSYFNRVSADRAFHDTFESNPDVLKSAFGNTVDKNGKPIETDYNNIAGDKDVKAVVDRIRGETYDKDESFVKSLNRVATSLMLGPLTNVHIAASSIANSLQYLKPTEAIPALAKAITTVTDGYAKAVTHGRIKPSTSTIGDIIDHNNTTVEKLQALASTIGKINGRDATNNFTNGFLQNIGEWVIKSKSIAANAGDKAAQDLMRRVDPDWQTNKKYSPSEIESLASTFGGIIHGSHDARTLPGWMLKDTAIQPFFSLASWNIAQTNAWMRHVLTPAKQGNFTPLIMSMFGSVLGGYIIKQGREALADKKSPIPSLQEIVNSSRGTEGNIPLLAYNGVAMSSYVGFAGILSVAAKAAFDLAYKNIPQAATFPLDEVIGNSAHRISQSVAALMNDPTAHIWNVGPRLAIDLAKENVQLARLALSWSSNSPELSKNIPGLEQERYSKQLNSKTSDLRRFKMVEGMPYDEQSISESNPYLGQGLKKFKRTEDIGEAATQLPDLISNAFDKANGNPDVLKNELHKIKSNTYETMPDPDRMPMSFMRYLNFLQQTQGTEAASDRLVDYIRHKEYNKVKSEMVPSI